jgi:hypothetical protein
VEAVVELDFYLTFYWQDDRLAMPAYWSSVDQVVQTEGVRLERIFYDSAGWFVWVPNIFFHDGLKITEQGMSISINASNTFTMSKHIIAALSQQHFSFMDFPLDTQDILVRFAAYGYTKNFLNMSLTENPISYMPQMNGGVENFFLHSEWGYDPALATAQVYDSRYGDVVYSDIQLTLPVQRYTNGIVIRLVIPIAILLLLAAATFYVENPESRISAATGLMIAVTAIYIVILGNIPFVNEATRMDQYVLVMLALLAGIIAVHMAHVMLYKTIYINPDDSRALVKYSRPLQYAQTLFSKSCLDCWCSDISYYKKSKLKHDANNAIGLLAMDQRTHEVAAARLTTAYGGTGRGEKSVTSSIQDSVQEKERRRPGLVVLMVVLQALGRTLIIPAVLLNLDSLMLTDGDLSILVQILGYGWFSITMPCEVWSLTCKVWELATGHNPLQERAEMLMNSYKELELCCRGRSLKLLPQCVHSYGQLLRLHTGR